MRRHVTSVGVIVCKRLYEYWNYELIIYQYIFEFCVSCADIDIDYYVFIINLSWVSLIPKEKAIKSSK